VPRRSVIRQPATSNGVKLDPDGRPWIVLLGTNRLATIDPQSFLVQKFDLPRAETRPRSWSWSRQ